MDRLFRIDFYPQDWLIDTARLTPEDRGIYIQIICLLYSNRGPIPNDPKWISSVSNTTKTIVKNAIVRMIELGFLQEIEGKLGQKRAQNEIKLKENHFEISSKGGKNGGGKNKKINDLEASGTDISLATPTATASPSPIAIEDNTAQRAPEAVKYYYKKIHEEGMQIFPKLASRRSAEISKWLEAGADPDLDILPELRRAAGKDIGSWSYFSGAIMDSLKNRLKPLPKGNENGMHQRKADISSKPQRAAEAIARGIAKSAGPRNPA